MGTGLSPNTLSVVWVEFGNATDEDGTNAKPFNTLYEAVAMLDPSGVNTIRFKSSGTTDETISIGSGFSPSITLDATNGLVRIGDSSASRPSATQKSSPASSLSIFDAVLYETDSVVPDASTEASAVESEFNAAIFEAIVPLQRDAEGNRIARADGVLAVRLRDYTGLQVETLWAELHPEHATGDVIFDWIPVNEDDDRDIWVIFSPKNTWYLEDLLTVLAGGANGAGTEILSDVQFVQVESLDDIAYRESSGADNRAIAQPQIDEPEEGVANRPTLILAPNLPGINGSSEAVTGYRISPDEIFRTPQRVWLPIEAGMRVEDVVLMYYKENEPNTGWHRADEIDGFLSDAEPVIVDGYYGTVVNHAGVIALLY